MKEGDREGRKANFGMVIRYIQEKIYYLAGEIISCLKNKRCAGPWTFLPSMRIYNVGRFAFMTDRLL